MSHTPIPIVLIGAGQRGARALASYALRRPEDVRVVAVAEPDDARRQQAAQEHHIPPKRCFRQWEDLLDAPLLGDLAVIAHPDHLHAITAIQAMQTGYHTLVQTPLAPRLTDCFDIIETAIATDQHLIVSHSLRYTAFYRALHDILKSGRIGRVINYRQERTLAFWHTAHQFIRNGDRIYDPNPLIFTEGIHEFDLMLWLLGESINSLSSVASVRHFHPSQAPFANVPARCVEDCPLEADCPYSAIGTYLEKRFQGVPQKGYPHTALANGDESPNALAEAVENQQWGKCVYHANRMLVDSQNILLKSESGVTVALTLNGRGVQDSRYIYLDGTHGTIEAAFIGLESHITIHEHVNPQPKVINFRIGPYGHGGDHGLMGNMCKFLRGETESLSLGSSTLEAHLLAFATEDARLKNEVVKFKNYAP